MRGNRELFEEVWQRRKRTWDEIAAKERRKEQEAFFRRLQDERGDDCDQHMQKKT